jgi:protein TonB
MQRALLVSAGLHVLALAALLGLRLPALPDAPQPARIEVLFGDTFPVPSAPTQAIPRPAQPGADAAPAAPASPAANEPGLRVERPDPTMIAARDVAGNRGPAYPRAALLHHEQGTVLLRLFIDAEGSVTRVETLQSSGVAALDAAAVAALSRWRFLPAERAGQPVASYRDQPVSFVLK